LRRILTKKDNQGRNSDFVRAYGNITGSAGENICIQVVNVPKVPNLKFTTKGKITANNYKNPLDVPLFKAFENKHINNKINAFESSYGPGLIMLSHL
jgi:hypothetical protein